MVTRLPSAHCEKKKHANTGPEHLRRKREDARHAAHTTILLYVLAILTSLIVGRECVVVASTVTALTLPLLLTPSLYQAGTTEVPSFALRIMCFIYLQLKFILFEVLYLFDLLVDLHLRCLFLEVHLLTSLCHTFMLAQRVTRRTCQLVPCGL